MIWVTVTAEGTRRWVADDREHAIEQHTDAGLEPIVSVYSEPDVGRRSVTVTITVDEEAWDEAIATATGRTPDGWDWLLSDVHTAIFDPELDGYLTAYTGQTYGKVAVVREPRIEDI